MKRLVSWNVNGIRAGAKKGLFEWMQDIDADVICLQETKAHPDQLNESFIAPPGYRSYWASAKKRGYSGVAVYTRDTPDDVAQLGVSEFDDEGRTLILEYPEFTLMTGYFPNSQDGGVRLDYKLEYCDAIMDQCLSRVNSGRHVVLCGDLNIAHKPIDLAHPKQNEDHPGYLPEERSWMDSFAEEGFIDTFRAFDPSPEKYTWWSYLTKARERNVGWRLDYFWVNEEFMDVVEGAHILDDVYGSDHCPVDLVLRQG